MDMFCGALIGEPLKMTVEIAQCFLSIAREWDIPSLTDLCLKFFERISYGDELLRKNDLKLLRQHLAIFATGKYLNRGCDFFNQILSSSECQLPDNTHFLDFVFKALGKFGARSSFMLSKLTYSELQEPELSALIGRLLPLSKDRVIKDIIAIAANSLAERQDRVCFADSQVQTETIGPSAPPELEPSVSRGLLKVAYRPGNELNGIFRLLNFACGGNVHSRGLVNITASSMVNVPPQSVIDFGSGPGWGSKSHLLGAWLQFDFRAKRITLSAYTLKTYNGGGYSSSHLKSWVVLGSNDPGDDVSWEVIDEQRACEFLNGDDRFHTWRVLGVKPYKTIRIKQTSESHSNSASMWLNSVEFFGTLD
jgi:hypothetical protein